MGSGINEIALIALIAFAIFFIPRMRAGKRQEVTFVKPVKKALVVSGRVRLAIFLSLLWIISVAFYFEPWNNNLAAFCYIGAWPIFLGWGLSWVVAGYKKYRR
ncbi:MAG: hypothetical protein EHM85_03525 [Desulfobacteraceae bacterium]|nr:MAG: hypothetical protein EHM85_03525 [Desulfobacteraceae bacterium]